MTANERNEKAFNAYWKNLPGDERKVCSKIIYYGESTILLVPYPDPIGRESKSFLLISSIHSYLYIYYLTEERSREQPWVDTRRESDNFCTIMMNPL